MVKITLEFPTIDHALVALAKINAPLPKNSAAPVAGEVQGSSLKASAGPDAAGSKQRKPRADKGEKRGSYKNAGAGGAVADAQKAGGAEPTPTVPAPILTAQQEKDLRDAESNRADDVARQAMQDKRDAAATPSIEDAQKALEAIYGAHGLPKAQEVLSRFGVQRLRDLLPEQRAEFIKDAEAAVAK